MSIYLRVRGLIYGILGKFLNCAINKGVCEEHAGWYVNWGVRFAKSIRGVPLKERSLEDVRLFLDDLAKRDTARPPPQVEFDWDDLSA